MKAKIIQTGEIVTIIAISTEHMTIQCYGNDGIVRLMSLSRGDIEIIPDTEKNIDWEQRRYEIVKDIVANSFSTPMGNVSIVSYIHDCVQVADLLTEELKK
jgi:ribonuclease III